MKHLLVNLRESGSVLSGAGLGFMGDPSAVEQAVTLASRDRLKRLCMPLPIQNEPLVVTEQLVLLLRFVNFLLVCEIFPLGSLLSDTFLQLFKVLINFFCSLSKTPR